MADKPIMREEKYLAYLTGDYTGELPKPITRKEKYLYELCLKGMGGEISPEEIQKAVNEYLEKNPVQPGATTEEAAQIKKNAAEINLLKESISTKITKFYASSQGETHLADSDNGKIMDMMVYGKSEQKQYSGKNLLNATLQTTTVNGITCTANGDGTYTLNGTATADVAFILSGDILSLFETNKKLKLVGSPKGGTSNSYRVQMWRQLDSPDKFYDYGNGVEISAPTGTHNIAIWIANKFVCNNLLFKPMITTDQTATYDDFEPYTGGQPSPSPDYPQEIKSVVNPTVKVCGKNLLKVNVSAFPFTKGGITFTYDESDGAIIINGTTDEPMATGTLFTALTDASKKYILSRKTANNSYFNITGSVPSNDNFYSDSNGTDLIDGGKYSIGIYFNKAISISNERFYIQLEEGSTPTAYEPYHEQTVTLPYDLYGVKVASGGNVAINGQQYESDYFDVERGKLVRRVLKFDPSLLSVRKKDDEKTLFVYDKFDNNNMYKKTHGEIIAECSHLKVTQNTAVGAEQEFENGVHVSFYAREDNQDNNNVIYICVPSACGTTASEFLEWSNKNAFEIIYKLATPTETDLTPEEIAALKALATYYPVTNISVNSEQLDGYTVFNYPISMANGWNYVKQQIGDTRDYIYDMDARTQDTDLQAAEAYVNSEYAIALTELEV